MDVSNRDRNTHVIPTAAADDEILRLRQRAALRAASGDWGDAAHPELKEGAAAWVGKMRAEAEARFQSLDIGAASEILT